MSESNTIVIFALETQRFGLRLSTVERVICAVEVTPLPKAPAIVLGVINLRGRIIPVLNIRKRFRLPEREIDLSDCLLIANTSRRTVALVVDNVEGVIERSEEQVIATDAIVPGVEYVEGIAKLEDGLILIHDLDKFLSLEEETVLDAALPRGAT